MKDNHYPRLLLMLMLSGLIMFGVMFLNVDKASHVYLSYTRVYMTFLMVAPMAILMVLMMPSMYPKKALNMVILLSSVVVFAAALYGLRNQAFIGDEQYMKAMIPHHSSAIMTSKAADIKDSEVRQLADSIIKSQEKEIEKMKAILDRMNK